MIYKKIAFLLSILICITGCISDNPYNNQHKKEKIGTIGGATSGALIGSYLMGSGTNGRIFGALMGGIIGGIAGNKAGAYLDEKAQQKMEQTGYYALNNGTIGNQYSWQSSNQVSGSFTPTHNYWHPNNGLYCREFSQIVSIGGQTQKAYGNACRMPDGSWKIMN